MKLKRAVISMLLILSMTTQVFAASTPPTKFGFPDINGHWAENYINDFQKNGIIKGYNIQTNQWDQLDYKTTNNGVYMAKTLPAGKYSKLEFYYYTSHSCMYNKSNITYTVKYHFE